MANCRLYWPRHIKKQLNTFNILFFGSTQEGTSCQHQTNRVAVCAVHSEIEPVFALALTAVLRCNADLQQDTTKTTAFCEVAPQSIDAKVRGRPI